MPENRYDNEFGTRRGPVSEEVSESRKGRVYLVGAGPGDPDLLTLRAARLIREAALILHDDLVSPEVLALASPEAVLINVGKRCGSTRISQRQIEQLMVEHANLGTHVVRLKGGDPMVFGRAGEEMLALRDADIDFEIVPGITTALAAAAWTQVPLTHRDRSDAIVFTTASRADSSRPDFRSLAPRGATLAIYMPGRDLDALRVQLTEAGFSPETDCVIASRVGTPDCRALRTSLARLCEMPSLPPPSIVLIGKFGEQQWGRDIAPLESQMISSKMIGDQYSNSDSNLSG